MSRALKAKIIKRKAVIAVMGLGYVGLPLAVSFAKAGFKVFGMDMDQDRVNRVAQKTSYISDISSTTLAGVVDSKALEATMDFSLIRKSDIVIICVPTPLKRKYTPDISFIVNAIKTIDLYLKKNTLVILESTTYPGTTRELIAPALEKSGLKSGRDFFLAFSPERIDPGNKTYQVTDIPKVVGGTDQISGDLAESLYRQIIRRVHRVSSADTAEMTKLLENSFRIVNIGWINELAMMCHKLGIDVWEVIEAAKTKPFGFMPFYPGLGVGGHCIPDDPLYLHWKAKQHGYHSKYIKLSSDTNSHMPHYVVERVRRLLEARGRKLAKSKILVLGVTYKKDVKDLRKSPPLRLIELLQASGGQVEYYDPFIPYLKIGNIDLIAIPWQKTMIKKYDCVVIATDHSGVDYQLVLKSAKQIFDIRNVFAGLTHPRLEKL